MSLPEADVKFLDAYCKHKGLSSRSEALHHAVNLLRTNWRGQEYEAAPAEWRVDEGLIWDSALMGFDDGDQTPHQREETT